MSEQPLFRSLDDLISELTSRGSPHREAVLQVKRELENGDLIVLDPHRDPWSEAQVLLWVEQVLQNFANWKPGARLPSMQQGVPDYVSRLRFCRVKQKGSARAGAGRREQFDWDDAEQCAIVLLNERGDPTDSLNQLDGWRSKTDLAKAVLDYLEKRAEKTGDAVPSLNRVRTKVPEWLKRFHALN
jgi:hypothetical protein